MSFTLNGINSSDSTYINQTTNRDFDDLSFEKMKKDFENFRMQNENEFNNFQNETRSDFVNFMNNINEDFEKHKNEIQENFAGFISNEKQKIMDFRENIQNEKNEFVKKSALEILNDLKNGFQGFVSLGGAGVIVYDNNKGYVLKRNNKEDTPIPSERLEALLDAVIQKNVGIYGESYKKE